MSLAKSLDIVWTDSPTVSCSGDNQNGLGHPLVYYNLTEKQQAVCSYCGRIFCLPEKKDGVSAAYPLAKPEN